MPRLLPLSDAKAHFSEVVRSVRQGGEEVVITVDGEPAVRVSAAAPAPRRLTSTDVATHRALVDAILRVQGPDEAFDAVELVGEGRR